MCFAGGGSRFWLAASRTMVLIQRVTALVFPIFKLKTVNETSMGKCPDNRNTIRSVQILGWRIFAVDVTRGSVGHSKGQ